MTDDADAKARATAHELIQGYTGPDRKVIDMAAFVGAIGGGVECGVVCGAVCGRVCGASCTHQLFKSCADVCADAGTLIAASAIAILRPLLFLR